MKGRFFFLLVGYFTLLSEAWAGGKVGIVPFVSAVGKEAGTAVVPEVSGKLAKKLLRRGFEAVELKVSGSGPPQLPNRDVYRRALDTLAKGKAALKKGNFEKASQLLQDALKLMERSMLHQKSLDQILEIYRLLIVSYFQSGMSDMGEEVLSLLGKIAPDRKFSRRELPPAILRMLSRIQNRAKRGKISVVLTFPAPATVIFDTRIFKNASSPLIIRRVPSGKHYLWILKPGHIPHAKPVFISRRRLFRISVDKLEPMKNAGPPYAASVFKLQKLLKKTLINSEARSLVRDIASSTGVKLLIFGFFAKENRKNFLHLFIYDTSTELLKKYPPIEFDLELLEVDITLIDASKKLAAALKDLDKLPNMGWRPTPVLASAQTADTTTSEGGDKAQSSQQSGDSETPSKSPPPPPRIASSSAGSDLAADDDDEERELLGEDEDFGKPAAQNSKKAASPPAERTKKESQTGDGTDGADGQNSRRDSGADTGDSTPSPRSDSSAEKKSPSAGGDSEGGDDLDSELDDGGGGDSKPKDTASSGSSAKNADKPPSDRPSSEGGAAPVEVRKPPRERSNRSGGAEPSPRSESAKPRKLASLPPAFTRKPGFDPDRDIDWSDPVPREVRLAMRSRRGGRYSSRMVPSPRKGRWRKRAPRRADDREPAPPPKYIPPPDEGWEDGEGTGKTTPPPKTELPKKARKSKPITSTWWFWTLTAAAVVSAGTVAAIAIIYSQPPTSYDVFVNTGISKKK